MWYTQKIPLIFLNLFFVSYKVLMLKCLRAKHRKDGPHIIILINSPWTNDNTLA